MSISSTGTISLARVRGEFGPTQPLYPASSGSTLTIIYPYSVEINGNLTYSGDVTIWSIYGDVRLFGTITSTGGSINIRAGRKLTYYRLLANQNVRLVSDYLLDSESIESGPITKDFSLGDFYGPGASSAGVHWYQYGFSMWDGALLPGSNTPWVNNTPIVSINSPQASPILGSTSATFTYSGRTYRGFFSSTAISMDTAGDTRAFFDAISERTSVLDSTSISNYYRSGSYVPNAYQNSSIPLSGTISLNQFRGAQTEFTSSSTAYGNIATTVYAPAGGVRLGVRMTGGGGGPGGEDDGVGAKGGAGTSLAASFYLSSPTRKKFVFHGADGGIAGGSGGNDPGGTGGAGWLQGGTGGNAGQYGGSGSGGGGGGAVVVQYFPDADVNSYVFLAGCGGGGGGAGRGRRYNVTSGGALPNLNWRGLTYNYNEFAAITRTSYEISTVTAWQNFKSGGARPNAAVRLYDILDGHGNNNMQSYYPVGGDDFDRGDLGGSGAGGGGNGIPGGIANASNNSWYWSWNVEYYEYGGSREYWTPPYEGGGLGGSCGYIYINSSFSHTLAEYSVNSNSAFGTAYGGETAAASGYRPTGSPGAIRWIITNISTGDVIPPLTN